MIRAYLGALIAVVLGIICLCTFITRNGAGALILIIILIALAVFIMIAVGSKKK